MDNIPLCKAHITQEEHDAVKKVLESSWLTHGPKTTEFENMFEIQLPVCHHPGSESFYP